MKILLLLLLMTCNACTGSKHSIHVGIVYSHIKVQLKQLKQIFNNYHMYFWVAGNHMVKKLISRNYEYMKYRTCALRLKYEMMMTIAVDDINLSSR